MKSLEQKLVVAAGARRTAWWQSSVLIGQETALAVNKISMAIVESGRHGRPMKKGQASAVDATDE
jgi:hypothetical protein